MATLFAKTAGGNWSAAGTWSNVSSAGADNSGPPTAATDCKLDAGSGNVTIDITGQVCRSLDCTGYPAGKTLTHNAFTLTIGDGTAGAGNIALLLSAAMTYTLGNIVSSAFAFVSTSATQQTVTTNGKTLGNVSFTTAGNWQLADNITMGQTFTVAAAATWDSNSKTITVTNTNNTSLVGGGKTFNGTVSFTGGGASQVLGANTITTLSKTGTAAASVSLAFQNSITHTITTLNVNGDSGTTNRMLIQSCTAASVILLGTAATLSIGTLNTTYTDWQDITAAGAANWDLSAITGKSGNCGGNSGITFTTGVQQFFQTAVTANTSDATKWFLATNGGGGAGRVPLPQDDARFDANSVTASGKTINFNVQRMAKNVDFTGITNSPSVAATAGWTLYGSLTLDAGLGSGFSNSQITFGGRSSFTLTSAGKTFANSFDISMFGGTLTLQDALTITPNNFSLSYGTFNDGGFNVTLKTFSMPVTNVRAIVMGAGTWSVTGNNTTIWSCANLTNFTLTRGNPVQFTYSGATGTRTISNGSTAGGTETNTIDISVTAGTDTVTFTTGGMARHFSFTGFSGTLSNLASSVIYGDFLLSATLTLSAQTGSLTFSSTSGTVRTITTAGIVWSGSITINGVNGSFQLGDNFVGTTAAGVLTMTNGTFSYNNKNFSIGAITIAAGTKTLTLGSGTFSLTATGTIANFTNLTNFTLNCGQSLISVTDTSATSKLFVGGGLTFYDLTCAGGTGTISFTGSNTFNVITLNCAGATNPYRFTSSTTTTMIWLATNADATHVGSLDTVSGAGTFTFSDTVGVDALDWFTITRSTATGGATWYAGSHSTNGGTNSGWIFSAAIVTTSVSLASVAAQSNLEAVTSTPSVGLATSASLLDLLNSSLAPSVGLGVSAALSVSETVQNQLDTLLPALANISVSEVTDLLTSLSLIADALETDQLSQIQNLASSLNVSAALDVFIFETVAYILLSQESSTQASIINETVTYPTIKDESYVQ